MKICVVGNIGAGKSTLIEDFVKEHPDYIRMPEQLDVWKPYFKPYYDAINQKGELSLDQQADIIAFQLITSLTRYQQYIQIDDSKNYIFERTVQESFKCFLPNLRKYITNNILYDTLYDFQLAMCRFEPKFDKVLFVNKDISVRELMERITSRNREDENITENYLWCLKQQYDKFEQTNSFMDDVKEIKNQHYIIGSVGVGKTTFLENLPFCRKQTEQINYWSYNEQENLLQRHLENVNKHKQNVWSFIFQLRVIASRILYQQNDMIYERNIIEEYMCFIEQYSYVFTSLQYKLLKDYYEVLLPHFLNNAVIYYIKPLNGVEQQMQQIHKRDRDGEDKYTKEYIEELNKKYDLLEQYIKKYNIKTLYYIYH